MLYEVCIAWNPSYGLTKAVRRCTLCLWAKDSQSQGRSHERVAIKSQWKKSRVDEEEERGRWEQECVSGAGVTGQGSLILPWNLAGGGSVGCASRPEFYNDGPLHAVGGNGLTFLTLPKSPEPSNVGRATNWWYWAQLCQGALQKRIS